MNEVAGDGINIVLVISIIDEESGKVLNLVFVWYGLMMKSS